MSNTLKDLYRLINRRDRLQALLLMSLVLLMALLEAVGIASIMPFLAVLANPDVIDSNRWLAETYRRLGFQSRQAFLFALGIGSFLLLVSSMIARALTTWVQLQFTYSQTHKIGLRLLRSYLRQPYHWFFDRHSADFAVKVLQEVSNAVLNAIAPKMQLVANVVTVSLISTILIVVDPLLAIGGVSLLGLAYSLVYLAVKPRLESSGKARMEANKKRFKSIHEAFGGIKYVKFAGLERRFEDRFGQASEGMARQSVTAAMLGELPQYALQSTVFGGMILALLYVMQTQGSVERALPIVGLYAIAGYRLMPALQGIYKSLSQIRFARPSLDMLLKDLHSLERREEEATQPTSASAPAPSRLRCRQSLELRSISYSYPNSDRPSIDGLTVLISAHSTVGIVGSTGSGKTTLLDIVLGLLQQSTGSVVVDGVSLDDSNIRSWQRSLGYVPQNIYLLDDTVAMNIAFGSTPGEVDRTRLEEAARAASIHDFIVSDLPKGYDTVIGEQGIRLSGGQRQRIGIARALYSDPELLVLDEATSALDSITEQVVMDAVYRLGRRKTVLLVAHRLSTVRRCDRIIVMDHGRIVADGSYDDLMRENDLFRSMVTTGH